MEDLKQKIMDLYFQKTPYRKIGKIVGLSHGKVGEIIRGITSLQGNAPFNEREKLKQEMLQKETPMTSKKLKAKKKKSKKDKEAKALKKQMAQMQNDLLNSQNKLEKSQSEAERLNGILERQDQEVRLQGELSDYFEDLLAMKDKAFEHEELLHSFNFLWEWKTEVSASPLLYKAFKEEYILASKLSDSFEQGLRKFDESKLLEKVDFNFSSEVISQIKSFIKK